MEKLAEIKSRLLAGEPVRLISTQVVEAGVDVDFPIVYRAMCGLDHLPKPQAAAIEKGRLSGGRVIFLIATNRRLMP
jgi:CRISPR-associated endonuclease/helicase Cas3